MGRRPGGKGERNVPSAREIREQYELHSKRSTAVNEALGKLRVALGPGGGVAEWEEALRVNRLSMWVHQVLAFDDALGLLRAVAKEVAGGRTLRQFGKQQKASVDSIWPASRATSHARGTYCSLCEVGDVFGVLGDRQYEHELEVAPRHFVWRGAWAHHGGKLREYHEETYGYFKERCALEDRNEASWPLDPAWSEARLSFKELVRILARAASGI